MDKTLPVPLKVEPSAPCSNIVQCPQTSATEHLLESATVVIDNVEVVECKIPTRVVDSGKHKEENELNLLVSDVRSASANNHQPQAQSKTQPHNTNPKLECGYVTNPATAPEPKYHDYSSDSLEALSGPESNSIVKVDVTSIDATPTTTPSVVILDDHKIQAKILKLYRRRQGYMVSVASIQSNIGTKMPVPVLASCLKSLLGRGVWIMGEYCINIGIRPKSAKAVQQSKEVVPTATKQVRKPPLTQAEGTKEFDHTVKVGKINSVRAVIVSETNSDEEIPIAYEENELEPVDHVMRTEDDLIVCEMDETNEVVEPLIAPTREQGSRGPDADALREVLVQMKENKKQLSNKQITLLIQDKISKMCLLSHMDVVEMSDIIDMLKASGLQLPSSDKTLRTLTMRGVNLAMRYKVYQQTRKGDHRADAFVHMKWREPPIFSGTGQSTNSSVALSEMLTFAEPTKPKFHPLEHEQFVKSLKYIVRSKLEYAADHCVVELSEITEMIRNRGVPTTSISDNRLRELIRIAVFQETQGKVISSFVNGKELVTNMKWKQAVDQPWLKPKSASVVSSKPKEFLAQTKPATMSTSILPNESPTSCPSNVAQAIDDTIDAVLGTPQVKEVSHATKTRVPTAINSMEESAMTSVPQTGNVHNDASTNLMREYQGADIDLLEQFIRRSYKFRHGTVVPIVQIYMHIIEARFRVKRDQLLWLVRKVFNDKIVIDTHKKEFFINLEKIHTLSSLFDDDTGQTAEQQHPKDGNSTSQGKINVSLRVSEFEALRCLKEGKILKAMKLVHPTEEEDAAKMKVMIAAKKIMSAETQKFASSSASDILKDQNPVTVDRINFLDLLSLYQEQLPCTTAFFRPCFSTHVPEYKEECWKRTTSKYLKPGYVKPPEVLFEDYKNTLNSSRKRTAALITKMLGLMYHKLSAYKHYVFAFLLSSNASTQVMFDLAQLGDSLYPAHLKFLKNNPQKHFKRCLGSEKLEPQMKAVIEKVEKDGPPIWYKHQLKQVNFSERTKEWQTGKRVVSDSTDSASQKKRPKRKWTTPEDKELYDMVIYSPEKDQQIPPVPERESEQSDPIVSLSTQSDQNITSKLSDTVNSDSLPKLPENKQQSTSDSHSLSASISDTDSIDAMDILQGLLGDTKQSTDGTSTGLLNNMTQEFDAVAAGNTSDTSQRNITQDDNTQSQSNPHNTVDPDAGSTETGEEEEPVDSDEDPEYEVRDVEFYGSDTE